MAEMHDKLQGATGPSELFQGRVLDADSDPELDRITAAAARALRAPTCVVSLLLDQVQYLRAGHGLPAELAESRTTARDVSLCQFVVRDRATYSVIDSAGQETDARDLLQRTGFKTYLGAPVFLAGVASGALCVLDRDVREFSDADRRTLERFALEASARLNELAAEQRGTASAESLLRMATRPVFQDLRNAIWQLSMSFEDIKAAADDAQPLAALAQQPGSAPTVAPEKLQLAAAGVLSLQSLTGDALKSIKRLEVGMYALEALAQRQGECADLQVILRSAANLAEHYLKLIGGVDLSAVPPTLVHATPAAALVQTATALSLFAEALNKARARGPLRVLIDRQGDRIELQLRSPSDVNGVAECVIELQRLIGAASGVSVACGDAMLCLGYRAARG